MGRTGRCAPILRLRSGHRREIPIAAQADLLSALDRSGAALYAPPEAKDHGSLGRLQGRIPAEPSSTVIVDDAVTTGASIARGAAALREEGVEPAAAAVLLCRDAAAAENLQHHGFWLLAVATITG